MENIEENMHAEIGALRVKGEQTEAIWKQQCGSKYFDEVSDPWRVVLNDVQY